MNGESIEPPQVQGVRGQGCEVGAGSGRRGWWRQQDAVDIGWAGVSGCCKRTNLIAYHDSGRRAKHFQAGHFLPEISCCRL